MIKRILGISKEMNSQEMNDRKTSKKDKETFLKRREK